MKYNDQITRSKTVKNPVGIMVWACFSGSGIGHMYRMLAKITINNQVYQDTLDDYLIPSIHELHPEGDYLFMQDSALRHTSALTIN